jgi:hypothetical protein
VVFDEGGHLRGSTDGDPLWGSPEGGLVTVGSLRGSLGGPWSCGGPVQCVP